MAERSEAFINLLQYSVVNKVWGQIPCSVNFLEVNSIIHLVNCTAFDPNSATLQVMLNFIGTAS